MKAQTIYWGDIYCGDVGPPILSMGARGPGSTGEQGGLTDDLLLSPLHPCTSAPLHIFQED